MDLLLHLVKQAEVDIHEVSIATILKSYLKHLGVLKALDLGDIGDFVVMASTLMEIKSRELLPHEEVSFEEELDPRDDLIRRLLQYKRFRDLSRRLDRMSKRRNRMVPLTMARPPQAADADDEESLDLGELGLWDLTEAFARLMEEIGDQGTLHVEVERRDVRFYTERLLVVFEENPEVALEDLWERSEGRYGLIGVLMSCLEMMKQGYLRAHQPDCFGPVMLAFSGESGVSVDDVLGRTTDEALDFELEAAEAVSLEIDAEARPLVEEPLPAPEERTAEG